ncbi:MAG: PilZ domain-containing protein [Spirochaetaceae bacterium]|jgi:hypothetical protein|nr:PilZ domain-containing protein [Spirochaetaceae bacterium]
MAIVVQRIEKEFLLGMLRYKGVPVKCFFAKKEYTFSLQSANEEQLIFTSEDDLSVFQKNMKIELKFSVQSAQMPLVTFSVRVCEATAKHLITTAPDYLYRNLQRTYSRVQQPKELNLTLKKDGFYYDLNYEKLDTSDPAEVEDSIQAVTADNIESLMGMNLDWIKQKTDGYKLVLFKNNPPATIEEKAVGKQGKILFISIPGGGFLSEQENSTGLCFTEQTFTAFLIENGESPDAVQEKITALLHQRVAQHICSDCFIPVLFSSYIVGYVHVWVNEGGKEPFTINILDKIRQHTLIVSFFLERKNFFKNDKKALPSFNPKLLDISAGGFLFVLDLDKEKALYALNDVFAATITANKRVIHCNAVIIRDYRNKTFAFYGCKFEDMEIEDIRFLFESIYGKPFTDKDLEFITGSV